MTELVTDIVERAFLNMERTQTKTLTTREKLKDKLESFIDKVDFSAAMSAKDLEATITAFNTLNTVLNDIDKQEQITTKLRLSQKKETSAEEQNKLIAQYIYKLHQTRANNKREQVVDDKTMDEEINKLYEEQCEPIREGEDE